MTDAAAIREEDEEDKKDKEALRRAYLISGAVFLAVLVVWIGTPFAVKAIVKQTLQERGQFGDLYGTVNALFSGLAFAGVIIAILLQRRELELQRRELRYTRNELKASVAMQDEAQKALNKTMYAQTFKVALDIFDSQQSLAARKIVSVDIKNLRTDPQKWSTEMVSSADVLIRVFESIGTLVRQGAVPAEYIVETWAIHIWRNWSILEAYIRKVRVERNNPLTAREFEKLYQLSVDYLEREGLKMEL